MFLLTIKDKFDSAHQLKNYKGKCSQVHGHTWKIEMTVEGYAQDEVGICADFKKLKDALKIVTDSLDHTFLNKKIKKPTAENIALYIYDKVNLRGLPVILRRIAVWETDNSCVVYEPIVGK